MEGYCPEVKKGWEKKSKGKLDLTKLVGHWRNVFDADHKSGQDCLGITLDFVDNEKKKVLHLK